MERVTYHVILHSLTPRQLSQFWKRYGELSVICTTFVEKLTWLELDRIAYAQMPLHLLTFYNSNTDSLSLYHRHQSGHHFTDMFVSMTILTGVLIPLSLRVWFMLLYWIEIEMDDTLQWCYIWPLIPPALVRCFEWKKKTFGILLIPGIEIWDTNIPMIVAVLKLMKLLIPSLIYTVRGRNPVYWKTGTHVRKVYIFTIIRLFRD